MRKLYIQNNGQQDFPAVRFLYAVLSVHFGIIGPAEKIIYGYAEIISEKYKRFIIGFTLLILITAYGILIKVKIYRQFQL